MLSPDNNFTDTAIVSNKVKITLEDIEYFKIQSRKKNDKSNKIRESIIDAILNGKIPPSFYNENEEWRLLKNNLSQYFQKLVPDEEITNITCIHRGGRQYYYDFSVEINNRHVFNIEFKFNARKVVETPQYVSPMKPSKYLTENYEEYFYENYLEKICKVAQIPLIDKSLYLKSIHQSNPECVSYLQQKYYQGCKQSSKFTGTDEDIYFYQKVKEYSKESIQNFVMAEDVRIDELSKYLLESQQNKIYMLYHQGDFYLEKVNTDNYEIVSVTKNKNKNGYVADTRSGRKIKILLRWKNGNGIAFPAFQIS